MSIKSQLRLKKSASVKDPNPRPVAVVAAEFGFNPEVFRQYLKEHEPDLCAEQGMTRLPNGRLVKKTAADKYMAAVKEFISSADSLKTIAARHGIVYNSIGGFIRRSFPEALEAHEAFINQSSIE